MKSKKAELPLNQVFSHPIRKLNASELEKVLAGYKDHSPGGGYKSTGGADNQGRNFS